MQRKGENLDCGLFFEFECLNMLDIADFDRSNGSELYTTTDYLYMWHDYATVG